MQKHIGLRDPELYEMEVRALLGLPINARVETFEDTGEVFLKHANRASELPGVDMTSLTPAQKTVTLHRMTSHPEVTSCLPTIRELIGSVNTSANVNEDLSNLDHQH